MITSISLVNFKCYGRARITFSPLTLVTGLNSAGKSTISQSLLLLRQSYLDGMLPGRGLSLNGRFVELGTGRDVMFESAESDQLALNLACGDESEINVSMEYNVQTGSFQGTHCAVIGNGFEGSLFSDRFQYLRAERLGPRSSAETSEYEVRQRRQLGPSGQFAAHFISCFGTEEMVHSLLVHPNSTGRSLLAQTEAWMSEVSPGVRLAFNLLDRVDQVRMSVSYAAAGSVTSEEYRPTNVGFGVSYALPIIIALLSTPAGGVVMLENPEAHLHPRGQRRIGQMLSLAAASGVQIIVETHSDHILNGVRLAVAEQRIAPEDTRILFNEWQLGASSPSVREIAIKGDGRLSQWPPGFFDEFDRSLDALLALQT